MLEVVTWAALALAVAAFGYALLLGIAEWKARKDGALAKGQVDAPRVRERMTLFLLAVVLMLLAGAAAAVDEKVSSPSDRAPAADSK